MALTSPLFFDFLGFGVGKCQLAEEIISRDLKARDQRLTFNELANLASESIPTFNINMASSYFPMLFVHSVATARLDSAPGSARHFEL